MPDNIIVDIRKELMQFQEDAAGMNDCEYYLDEVVTEVMMFISDRNHVEHGIQWLRDHFYHMHAKDNYVHDGEIIADAVVKLARALVALFDRLGAYLLDGNLPFELQRWLDTSSPVFSKFLDYQP